MVKLADFFFFSHSQVLEEQCGEVGLKLLISVACFPSELN